VIIKVRAADSLAGSETMSIETIGHLTGLVNKDCPQFGTKGAMFGGDLWAGST
jgi:hypothetical protein